MESESQKWLSFFVYKFMRIWCRLEYTSRSLERFVLSYVVRHIKGTKLIWIFLIFMSKKR